MSSSTLVVGAAAAGLATATALRRADPQARVTLLGEEHHHAYDRPPLSKQILAGTWEPQRATLPGASDLQGLGIDVVLGERAVALDVAARAVKTASGRVHTADDIVIATGLTARTLPGVTHLAGAHVVRTLDDSSRLRAELLDAERLVVVGEGVLGCEIAATARRDLDLEVTLVGALPSLLERQLGATVGGHLNSLHERNGVVLRLGVTVTEVEQQAGRVSGVITTSAAGQQEFVPADVLVVAIGGRPSTDWLEGSGLRIDDGVVCDSRCRAAPGIWAAGDVARFHHEQWQTSTRLENRTNATAQSLVVAANVAGADQAYQPVPYFWTDQFDAKLQIHGRVGPDQPVHIVEGDPAAGRFVALYGSSDEHSVVTGLVGCNMPKPTRAHRRHVTEATPWDTVTRTAPV